MSHAANARIPGRIFSILAFFLTLFIWSWEIQIWQRFFGSAAVYRCDANSWAGDPPYDSEPPVARSSPILA